MRMELRYFLAAIQVLTRLPVPPNEDFAEEWMERGVKYFPLAGAIAGAVCAIVLLLSSKVWSGALPALLAVAAGMAITGGLHEDGFADFFDAMGGATRDARLDIMKDSRLGTYGVLALGVGIGLKVLALAALPVATGAGALVAAHAGGRLGAVCVIATLTYAGGIPAAKIKPLGHITVRDLAIALAFGALPLIFLPIPFALAGLAAALLAVSAVTVSAQRLLGGYTGDVLGAVEQAFEIAFLLGTAACA